MFAVITRMLLHLILITIVQSHSIFKIGLQELDALVSSSQISKLETIISTQGALAVTGMPQEYRQAVTNLKRVAPGCLEQLNYPQFYLPDGSQRRTFAKSSEDTGEYPECIKEHSETVSKHLDMVDVLMSRIVTNIAGEQQLEWRTKENNIRGNFSTLMYKEHIHVYQPVESLDDDNVYAAPFHTDNGLLLLITPFQEHPLLIKNKMGHIVNTGEVGDDSLLVLVAAGLPKWLLKNTEVASKFFPVPHAVPSLVNDISSRTVFARMKVVPMDAYAGNKESHVATDHFLFEQFFNGIKQTGAEELCPIKKPAYQLALEKSWTTLKSTECSKSEAYCWMNCLELPTSCPDTPVQCLNSAKQQCCTDTIKENCQNMDQSCKWECKADNGTTEGKFCNGQGTDMYMQGFTASGNDKDACVILLFKSWVLDTRTKFGFGCVGVIILGIAIEGMLCLRRELQSRKILLRISGVARRVLIVVLFSLNIASGYLAMLVAMTYSVELFICMVIGLVVGHAIFNTGAAVGESVDPCCASQAISHTNDAKQREAENTCA